MSQTIQCNVFESLNSFMKKAPRFDGQTKQDIESFFAYCMEGQESLRREAKVRFFGGYYPAERLQLVV